MRLRTKRPTNGPARSVAIEPAAEVAALRIGFERELRPVTAAAAIVAAEPITAPPARLAALLQMLGLNRSRRPTASRPCCSTSAAVDAASAALRASTSSQLSRSTRASYFPARD